MNIDPNWLIVITTSIAAFIAYLSYKKQTHKSIPEITAIRMLNKPREDIQNYVIYGFANLPTTISDVRIYQKEKKDSSFKTYRLLFFINGVAEKKLPNMLDRVDRQFSIHVSVFEQPSETPDLMIYAELLTNHGKVTSPAVLQSEILHDEVNLLDEKVLQFLFESDKENNPEPPANQQ